MLHDISDSHAERLVDHIRLVLLREGQAFITDFGARRKALRQARYRLTAT